MQSKWCRSNLCQLGKLLSVKAETFELVHFIAIIIYAIIFVTTIIKMLLIEKFEQNGLPLLFKNKIIDYVLFIQLKQCFTKWILESVRYILLLLLLCSLLVLGNRKEILKIVTFSVIIFNFILYRRFGRYDGFPAASSVTDQYCFQYCCLVWIVIYFSLYLK